MNLLIFEAGRLLEFYSRLRILLSLFEPIIGQDHRMILVQLQRIPFECVDCMTLETAANVAQTGSLRSFNKCLIVEATQTASLRYIGAILDFLRIVYSRN